MKVTCVVGSARNCGSTAYLIDAMVEAMTGQGISVRKYCISDMKIQYCLGCKQCYLDGKCVQKDDVAEMVACILDSDYVVMAAPSYWAGVPGQLKTFFDRNTPYGDTNPNRILQKQKEIKGIAIAIRAGTHAEENELILNEISHYYGHLGIQTVKRISICGVDCLNDLLQKHSEAIQEVVQLGQHIGEL